MFSLVFFSPASMTPTRVTFRVEIEDANAFACHCEEIEPGEILEELYRDPESGVTQAEMEGLLLRFRDFYAGQLARFLLMGSTMRNNTSVRTGNISSAEFVCAEAAERVRTEVMKKCPPGLRLIDVSEEEMDEEL